MMAFKISTIFISLMWLLVTWAEEPIINTYYGKIKGTILHSRQQKPFAAFRGIPFAEAPTGDLRFKAPVPIKKWKEILDATKDGPLCAQVSVTANGTNALGQEDCLYINVYVPKHRKKNDTTLLPVLVYIHQGAFIIGRSKSDYLGPEYFMDQSVILVTFNYRVGILGFLTTHDDEAPGNYGFKDQLLALKWVNHNIKHFGGDNQKVTIFGQAAGAVSVHYHLLSPASKGLFHGAISQSGTALLFWSQPNNDYQNMITTKQANFSGCGEFLKDNKKLMQCLRQVDVEKLVKSVPTFKDYALEALYPYPIAIEKKTRRNPNPYFTKDPLSYIQEGNFSKVPWIIGLVQDEGIVRAAPILRQTRLRKKLNDNFNELLPDLLHLSFSVNDTKKLWSNIKQEYFQNQNSIDVNNSKSVQSLIDLFSDRVFIYGAYQSAMLHSAKGHKDIWFYNFDYRGEYSFVDTVSGTKNDINFKWGVCHADDLLYLFKFSSLFGDLKENTDILMSQLYTKVWSTFAKYGNPDAANVWNWCHLDVKSEKTMTNDHFCFLNITSNFQHLESASTKGFRQERMKFWARQPLHENVEGLD